MRPLTFLLCYLLARTVGWTLLLFFTQPAPPMDVLEHLAWGREWRLVYAHHPGLPAWLDELFYSAGGVGALAALAPLGAAAAMGAAYYAARLFVTARRAVVCALALEGVLYFNVLAVEFNHNVAQLAACAWLVAVAGRMFLRPVGLGGLPASRDLCGWGVLGVVAAVAVVAKYSSLLFLVALFAWSVAAVDVRRHWKTPGPWFALAVFVVCNIPQVFALAELRFAPLQFALSRAAGGDGFWGAGHLAYPLRFFAAQVGAFFLAGVLCAAAGVFSRGGVRGAGVGGAFAEEEVAVPPPQGGRSFLFVAAFGALLAALFISFLFALRLRSMWGAAMLTFIPLWLFVFFPRPLRWRRWLVGFVVVAVVAPLAVVAIQVGAPFINKRGKRIHYPGAAIAAKAEELWRTAHPAAPLCYVAGPKHIAALTAFYAMPRLSAVLDGDWGKSFWTTREMFRRFGGVIVWVADDGRRNAPPPAYAAELSGGVEGAVGDAVGEVYNFRWKTAADLPPLKIGFALAAPLGSDEDCPR